jgi:large subunit ribosomal protein L3
MSKRGSRGYSPRKRARDHVARFSSWPEVSEGPRLQGFAGFKAGMTHAFVVDYRPTSNTSGQEVQIPVTVVEVPPMKVAAVRVYERTGYGLKTVGEAWAKKLDDVLAMRLTLAKDAGTEEAIKRLEASECEEVRVLIHTQPDLVTGIPKHVPDLMEVRVGGGTYKERLAFAKGLLGKEITIKDFTTEGQMVDVASITKGKGFQGHTKRWGVKLMSHKNSKHRRMIGTLGPKSPKYVRPTVPQAGQTGYHQRTEFNKRILKIGDKVEEINPKGGFLHYGQIRNSYVILHGSIPGPTKRLIGFRDTARRAGTKLEKAPEMTYVSLASKQGT